MLWIAASIALLGLSPVLQGFLPGRVLLPMDQLLDTGVWKRDPAVRVPVSNRLDSDPIVQFHPWDEAALRLLRSGEFRWRNQYAGDGAPLFANPQAALLSPFTWPRLALEIRGWTLSVVLKLLAMKLGFFWLTREMGAERDAALLSGLISMGSGFVVVWALHPTPMSSRCFRRSAPRFSTSGAGSPARA